MGWKNVTQPSRPRLLSPPRWFNRGVFEVTLGGEGGVSYLHSILHINNPLLDGQLRISVQGVQPYHYHDPLPNHVTRF
jgi:hypothetical protein